MRILLCCVAGVTSNMFAAALKDEAEKKGMDVMVWAASQVAVEYSIDQADIVLVTPQLAGSLHKFEDLASVDTPVILISEDDFKTFNAKKVLEEAIVAKEAIG